jgi:geranylgeranyl pyrophosphate synthase
MTEAEKSNMMAEMDKAAHEAEKELKAMSQHMTVPIARWWHKHYLKAGHKRLGRMMVAHAKAMAGTTPDQWADADEKE